MLQSDQRHDGSLGSGLRMHQLWVRAPPGGDSAVGGVGGGLTHPSLYHQRMEFRGQMERGGGLPPPPVRPASTRSNRFWAHVPMFQCAWLATGAADLAPAVGSLRQPDLPASALPGQIASQDSVRQCA